MARLLPRLSADEVLDAADALTDEQHAHAVNFLVSIGYPTERIADDAHLVRAVDARYHLHEGGWRGFLRGKGHMSKPTEQRTWTVEGLYGAYANVSTTTRKGKRAHVLLFARDNSDGGFTATFFEWEDAEALGSRLIWAARRAKKTNGEYPSAPVPLDELEDPPF